MSAARRGTRPSPLLAILAELYASVEERDVGNVERVCGLHARRLPRDVREEAMAVARTPGGAAGGHRAPVRLLMFWRAARVLDSQDRVDAALRDQLELDLRAPRDARAARRRHVARPDLRLERHRAARDEGAWPDGESAT